MPKSVKLAAPLKCVVVFSKVEVGISAAPLASLVENSSSTN